MKKFQFINRYAKPYTLKFIVLFLCIVITVLIGAVFPYISGRLIDVIFYEKDLHLFFFVIEIYVFLFLVNQVFHFILNMNWAYLMTEFLFDIKEDIFKKVLSLKGQYLADMHSGDIIKRMSDDTEQIMELIHWNIFYAAGEIVNLGISIFFLFYINWGIADGKKERKDILTNMYQQLADAEIYTKLDNAYHFIYIILHLYKHAWLDHLHKWRNDVNLVKFADVYHFWRANGEELKKTLPAILKQHNIAEPIMWTLIHTDSIFDSHMSKELMVECETTEEYLHSSGDKTGNTRIWKGSMRERLWSKKRETLFT